MQAIAAPLGVGSQTVRNKALSHGVAPDSIDKVSPKVSVVCSRVTFVSVEQDSRGKL